MSATTTAYHEQYPQEALNCCVQIAHRQLSNYGYDLRLLPPDDYASEAMARILDEDKIKSPPLKMIFSSMFRRLRGRINVS